MLITQEQLPMVEIPSMNDTHLEEILLINRLEKLAKEGDVQGVSESLKELHEHTAMHFYDEEELMEEGLFPAFATHKGEHDRHLHELNALREYFEKNKDTNAIVAYIEGNLVKWLIHHIETMDTMTAKYLSEGVNSGCGATKGCTTNSC